MITQHRLQLRLGEFGELGGALPTLRFTTLMRLRDAGVSTIAELQTRLEGPGDWFAQNRIDSTEIECIRRALEGN